MVVVAAVSVLPCLLHTSCRVVCDSRESIEIELAAACYVCDRRDEDTEQMHVGKNISFLFISSFCSCFVVSSEHKMQSYVTCFLLPR